MTAIEELKHEHRIIEKVLGAIELEAAKASPNLGLFSDAVDFVRNFADKCHHGKEEGILFKAMAGKGVPVEGGPIGVMVSEHEAGRLLIGQARDALKEGKTAVAAGRLAEYVRLLRQHIYKEDNVLYPMAEKVLGPGEFADMGKAFEKVEAEEMGEGTHERYHEMAHRLADRAGG